MGLKIARTVYAITLLTWSIAQFVLLIPEISKKLHSLCWNRFESGLCSHVTGIQAGYRITLSGLSFHFLLSFLTIRSSCAPNFSNFIHINCWLLKIPIFLAINILIFVIPINELALRILYYIYLVGAVFFIVIMFIVGLDASHAWKILWMRSAHARTDEPTCYLCTWLFLIHLVTSLLYAVAFDIILSFFFFNSMSQCVTTLSFLAVNIFLCLVAVTLSYFPLLKETQASSQIILSTMIFYVTFITWLALSDTENEYCNMFGTPFSGSKRRISLSFRSLAGCTLAALFLAFLTLRNEAVSFTYSLIDTEGNTDQWRFLGYSRYHLSLCCTACFFAMSMTNWYDPFLENTIDWDRGRLTHLIDLQEYNYYRFIFLCMASSFLPLLYIGLLTFGLCRRYFNKHPLRKHDDSFESQAKLLLNTSNESNIRIEYEDAIKMLRKSTNTITLTRPTEDAEITLVPCYQLRETRLRFWHLPRNISQSYYGGRNGSNACTIIALIIGRLFSRSEIFMPPFGYLSETWINLYITSIVEGNAMYDTILKEFGVLDLSIEEAAEHFGAKLNIKQIGSPLPVTFEAEIETVRVAYQLKNFVNLCKKQVILFIHRFRTGSFLVYPDGSIIFSDTHSYGEEGSLLVWAGKYDVDDLVEFLKHVLGTNENKLATLTDVEYESRFKILRGSLPKYSKKEF